MDKQLQQNLVRQLQQRYRDASVARHGDGHILSAAGWLLDYSKNTPDDTTWDLLIKLAEVCEVSQKKQQLLAGQWLNTSEDQLVLHTLMRNRDLALASEKKLAFNIDHVWQKMQRIVEKVRQKKWLGFSGKAITDVVNLGVGGSDWGPKLAVEVLADGVQPRCHFVSNLDPQHLFSVLNKLNPATTLFIVTSKSFATQETLTNAQRAKKWLLNAGCITEQLSQHLLAVTANQPVAEAFGVRSENCLPMAAGVGGRFSWCSAVGITIALAIGMDAFQALLDGAHAMDQHFNTAALADNMPVILALLDYWYVSICGNQTRCVTPYSYQLRSLVPYLQQLHMESLGKAVDLDNQPLGHATGPIIWGEVGSDSQHTFAQFLLQAHATVPVDFILPLQTLTNQQLIHNRLVANCQAQSQLLWQGNDAVGNEKIAARGPNNLLITSQLTPKNLGALLALYEHKVFVLSVLWQINAFDQPAVSYGKALAQKINKSMQSTAAKESGGEKAMDLRQAYLKVMDLEEIA